MRLSSNQVRAHVASFDTVLDAARQGEGWAFDELFGAWNGRLTGFVRARGIGDVEAVVNDVFLKAFGAVGTFTGDEAAFRAWLFRIARNRVIDEYRKLGRAPETADLDAAAAVAGGDVVVDAERRFSDGRLLELLGLLTDEQREVLALRFVADLTIDQIAEVTNRRRGAVKQLQRRALRRLEAILEGGES